MKKQLTTLTSKISLSCLVLALTAFTEVRADQPNVLFIAIDDLNDWVGCLNGHPQTLTPNIDRLAARGVLFTNAHCASPACNPSRAAVFSGQMPGKTGVWSNNSKRLMQLHPDKLVLSRALQQAGYRTLGSGKLLHSQAAARSIFDEYYSVEQRWSPLSNRRVRYTKSELPSKRSDQPRHVVELNGKTIILPLNQMPSDRRPETTDGESFDWGPMDVPDAAMGDAQIVDWSIDKLKDGFDGNPFFMGVGFYRPHIPLWAPKQYFERFEQETIQLPEVDDHELESLSEIARKWAIEPVTAGSHATVVKYGQWREAVKAYLACVTFVDYHLGRLIDALDSSPYADNTLIVLWSDHGWHLGEKHHWGKWTGWERSTRVPLIIAPPKNQRDVFGGAVQTCEAPVSLIDLYPTIVDFCKVSRPGDLDGRSLLPLLVDPTAAFDRTVVTMFGKGNVSLRDQRFRYIRYKQGPEELYDLKADPQERHNLIGDTSHSAVISKMRQQTENDR